jgi:hypothetical protein
MSETRQKFGEGMEQPCKRCGQIHHGALTCPIGERSEPAAASVPQPQAFRDWLVRSMQTTPTNARDEGYVDALRHALLEFDMSQPADLVKLVADLQAHAKECGWQDVDEPIARLLEWQPHKAASVPLSAETEGLREAGATPTETMQARAELAGRVFSKTPHPGMDEADPDPLAAPAVSREASVPQGGEACPNGRHVWPPDYSDGDTCDCGKFYLFVHNDEGGPRVIERT